MSAEARPGDALADLRALAAAPNPDARPFVACEAFITMSEVRENLWRMKSRGHQKICQAMTPKMDALEEEISKTKALTKIGLIAKAGVGLHMLGQTGTIAMVPRSILRDFVSAIDAMDGAL